jgi:hypothetical protein
MLSREEVMRLQDLRGMYGIASPAPICADGEEKGVEPPPADDGDVSCQVLQAPSSPDRRLVSEFSPPEDVLPPREDASDGGGVGKDGEIRLTYRELTALIKDAVKQLR